MDISKTLSTISDSLNKNKLEIACFGITTALFQLIVTLRGKKNKNEAYSPMMSNQADSVIRHKLPQNILNSNNPLLDEIKHLNNPACKIEKVLHLITQLDLKIIPAIKSPLLSDEPYKRKFGGQGYLPVEGFVYRGSFVLAKNVYSNSEQLVNPKQWLLAGPRQLLYFEPSKVKAAIVTCGGLCPGLNVVIREIFINLEHVYGCKAVYGIRFGYMGFSAGDEYWMKLSYKDVRWLQFQGGTCLGSSRGGFDEKKIVQALIEKGINQVYAIGGDGTHRAIIKLYQEIKKRRLQISVVGIPKTIDNDIPIIDKSFGFETAIAESLRSIRSAYVESRGVNYGIGLVKLMGRNSGFIAVEATTACQDVDICLIPERQFDLYGKNGLLEYILNELKVRKHLVIVIAEGAGAAVRDVPALRQGVGKDASGNIKLPNIGEFLKGEIIKYCKSNDLQATLKYIDPAYMIRTVPANCYDRKLCSHLASSAVHGSMAGFTAFTVGHINNTPAMIPISALQEPRTVDESNRAWYRVLARTGQPAFVNLDISQ